MPEGYRKTLIRQISQHAHSEIVGQLPEGNWITRAPTLERKAILLAKVQDEAGHGLYLYCAAETLGVTRDQLIEQLHAGKAKYSSIFNYPTLTWADMGAIGWLVDGAAIMNQIPLQRCSYGPYARAMVRDLQGGELPPAPGLRHHDEALRRHAGAEGDGAGRAEPLVVAVADDVRPAGRRLGPQRAVDAVEDQDGLQRRAAPALRRPDRAAGRVSRPDHPRPRAQVERRARATTTSARSTGTSSTQVIKGNGPCNRERLQARVDAWEEGAWVREASLAYAEKRAARRAGQGGLTRRSASMSEGMAALGDLHPQPARAGAQARRQPARAGCRDGDQERARRLHAAQRGREHLGRAGRPTSRPARPSDKGPLFEPANSKVYRHPTFFQIPEKLEHM